jgi:hypothetical protein
MIKNDRLVAFSIRTDDDLRQLREIPLSHVSQWIDATQVGGGECRGTFQWLEMAAQSTDQYFCPNSCSDISYSGLPKVVTNHVACHNTCINTLHNIHKTHEQWVIGGTLILPFHCTHIMGLAYIPGIRAVAFTVPGAFPSRPPIIVNHDDPFLWQEQLLEMGLVEQAQM